MSGATLAGLDRLRRRVRGLVEARRRELEFGREEAGLGPQGGDRESFRRAIDKPAASRQISNVNDR